jgi:peptidoglycan/LPS O-acetylase OafA/YrhL
MLHHLAFYGPMSDVAMAVIPGVIDFFFVYGRMAVAVFLVIGGFLTGQKLFEQNVFAHQGVFQLIWHKYQRLVIPYLAAIILAIICSFIASRWMTHPSISAMPEPEQLISHLFFLQNLLGYESLSAGLWYVAMDFQLFAVTALALFLIDTILPTHWSYQRTQLIGVLVVTLITLASLFIFNLDDSYDATFLYFYVAYGLGILAARIAQTQSKMFLLFLLLDFLLFALYLDFRGRVLIAGVTAAVLCLSYQSWWVNSKIWMNPLAKLGRMSYSIFLVHFPISLVVSSIWVKFYPDNPWLNVAGMITSALLSLLVAIPFYQFIEKR